MSDQTDRDRIPLKVTLAPDVYHLLKQPERNASGTVETAVRNSVPQEKIEEAAREAGMTSDEIEEARQR